MPASPEHNPSHIAIIMDGNGRWAKNRGRPRASGHQSGFHAARDIVEAAGKRNIAALTLFAFSSENWKRPSTEVNLLLDLFMSALRSEVDKLADNNVHMRFIGERAAFPKKLQEQMRVAEQRTSACTGLKLAIAVNYGGRWDIVDTARRLAIDVQRGKLQPEDITVDRFSSMISLADCGEPDLLIRTGGETRISNYLLWQLAYTELYFSDVLWPDFDGEGLDKAIAAYRQRQRRFGKTGEQVMNGADSASVSDNSFPPPDSNLSQSG